MKRSIAISLAFIIGMVTGAEKIKKDKKREITKIQNVSDKNLELFLMMNQWVKLKQKRKNVGTYLIQSGYRKIAIYGMSHVGETLLDELKNTEVEVSYAIDRIAGRLYAEVDVFSLEDSLQQVDAVIVTVISCFEEIENELRDKLNCPVISLYDLLYEA